MDFTYASSLRSVTSNSAYYYKTKLAPGELPLEAPAATLKMEDTGLINLPKAPAKVKSAKKKGTGKKVSAIWARIFEQAELAITN